MASSREIREELERRGYDPYEITQMLRDRDPFDKGMDQYESDEDVADRLEKEYPR